MSKIIKKGGPLGRPHVVAKPSSIGIMPEGGGVLNKKVMDAKAKAQAIVDEAVLEADRIREEAIALQERIKKEMEKAKKDGFAAGREEGMSAALEKAVALQDLRDRFYAGAEPEIIKLVMTIAEKVIGKMVREHEGAIKSIVRQAVDSTLGERITVKLNPEDYKIITAGEHEFKDIFDRTKRIAFKEDEAVKKGGCMVETEIGTIDARLETQLKAIKKALEL